LETGGVELRPSVETAQVIHFMSREKRQKRSNRLSGLRSGYAGAAPVRRSFFEKIVRARRLAKFRGRALICCVKRPAASHVMSTKLCEVRMFKNLDTGALLETLLKKVTIKEIVPKTKLEEEFADLNLQHRNGPSEGVRTS
jgi:hypothetical protein